MTEVPRPTAHVVMVHLTRYREILLAVLGGLLLGSVMGGLGAWGVYAMVNQPLPAYGSPPGTSAESRTPFAPTATGSPPTPSGPLHVIAEMATATPSAIPKPTPTYTPYARCRPDPGTATPRIGQSCFNAIPTAMPARMTATIEPFCPDIATPGTWCIWQGANP
jgi:hypothetical protein